MFSSLFSKKPKAEDLAARLSLFERGDQHAAALKLEGPNAPVLRNFFGSLYVSYAFDLPSVFQAVLGEDQKRLNLTDDQLHEAALRGVERRALPLLKLHRDSDYFALTCGGNFEATLLLIDSVWNQARTELTQDDVVAFAPSKDLLFFCAKNSHEGRSKLQSLRARIKSDGHLTLAPDFLLREGHKWTPFEP